jgi:hypothetical protein
MGVISGGKVIEGARSRVGGFAGAEGLQGGALNWVRADYSFAADGGAIGSINLSAAGIIPAGAIITDVGIEVTTPPTSGGAATIALTLEGAGDLLAAAAISGAPWSTTGRKNGIPVGTFATSVKTTAARAIVATIAAAALTAGVFSVYVGYLDTANA